MKRLKFLRRFSVYIDILFVIPVLVAGLILKVFRLIGSKHLGFCTDILRKLGVFPIINHYYEPWFMGHHDVKSSRFAIQLDIEAQSTFLKNLQFSDEFLLLLEGKLDNVSFDFALNNGSFGSGDAELLYNFVRYAKPKKVLEIGCGSSTKLMLAARTQNKLTDELEEHVCIEPFEQPWLESLDGITVVRECVENVDVDWSSELDSGDLLFIDSSHMLRPGGDVHFEYSTILPSLKAGVYIHIHDIFLPNNYLPEWLEKDVKFWNEQYLLECILANTDRYEVILAANYLKHSAYSELKNVCPCITREREPGSLYLRVR